jgi:hypothetical protein
MMVLKRLLQVLLGVALACVIAEAVFWWRDDGAFPHVNFYVADAQLGVRLKPNASERLAVATNNPVTTIHTNDLGHRGDAWPAPHADEIVVVGDSQVFGLGVDDNQTFSVELQRLMQVPVINAGVPTYGPEEYVAALREVVKARGSKRAVVVINSGNDFFEALRPNTQRHEVFDGWAVRKRNKTEVSTWFPMREWLMSQSHAVFAWRKLNHRVTRRDSEINEEAAATPAGIDDTNEGGWTDLLRASEKVKPAKEGDEGFQVKPELQAAMKGLTQQQIKLLQAEEAVNEAPFEGPDVPEEFDLGGFSLADVAGGKEGDVVHIRYAEAARSITLTAALIEKATRLRAANLAKHKKVLDAALKAAQGRRVEVQTLRWARAPQAELSPAVQAIVDACHKAAGDLGVDLMVALLPLDVQVSADEWAKYGEKPIDLSTTKLLHDELVNAAQARGLRAFDATESMRAAMPGAFLYGDLHMTPKGHAAFAQALAVEWKKPHAPQPRPYQQAGVGALPSPLEWDAAPEVVVKGSSALHCETKFLRGWFRMRCLEHDSSNSDVYLRPLFVIGNDNASEVVASVSAKGSSLLLPVSAPITVPLAWNTKRPQQQKLSRYLLRVDSVEPWVASIVQDGDLTSTVRLRTAPAFDDCAINVLGPGEAIELYGDLNPRCLEEFPDCVRRLACAEGHPDYQPTCTKDEVRVGAFPRCTKTCVKNEDCTAPQTCTSTQGVQVCR